MSSITHSMHQSIRFWTCRRERHTRYFLRISTTAFFHDIVKSKLPLPFVSLWTIYTLYSLLLAPVPPSYHSICLHHGTKPPVSRIESTLQEWNSLDLWSSTYRWPWKPEPKLELSSSIYGSPLTRSSMLSRATSSIPYYVVHCTQFVYTTVVSRTSFAPLSSPGISILFLLVVRHVEIS